MATTVSDASSETLECNLLGRLEKLFAVKTCQNHPVPLHQNYKGMEHRHFMNFDIAGFTYWDGALVLCDLKPGKKVRLEREEDNKFAPYAVVRGKQTRLYPA